MVLDESTPLTASFRDPAGFLFKRDGILYRQINQVHASNFDLLSSSGLYEDLNITGRLIPHSEVPDVAPAGPNAYKVIRPDLVWFVSYPYEWSFLQLKDAALLTLDVQLAALQRGMSLRDATAFNVQFLGTRPVFIDTLSFEKLQTDRPWVAYRQFCQHFLAPLAIMRYTDVRLGTLTRNHIDGIPLDVATSLIPRRTRLRPSLGIHLHAHARSQRRHESDSSGPGKAKFSDRAMTGLIESLRSAIKSLVLPKESSTWGSYYEEAAHYSGRAMEHKKELVAQFVEGINPKLVWDLGGNVGVFSKIASDRGIHTVNFDFDAGAIEEAYKQAEGDRNFLPLIMDLTNPSPGLGWRESERSSLAERGPADMALALALVHHIAIANNVPLEQIAGYFRRLANTLVIEFVPKQDEMVKRLLATREDIFPGYNEQGFENAFSKDFIIEQRKNVDESERKLYLMKGR